MIRARSVFGCLLALILMFGSVMGALARREQAGVTAVTLCGAEGAAALQIDAGGNLIKAGYVCPDCVAASAVAALAAPLWVLVLTRVRDVAFQGVAAVLRVQGSDATARGPPDLV